MERIRTKDEAVATGMGVSFNRQRSMSSPSRDSPRGLRGHHGLPHPRMIDMPRMPVATDEGKVVCSTLELLQELP